MPTLPKVSRRTANHLALAFCALTSGYAAQNYVKPDQFGVRETFGNVSSGILPGGLYLHVPLAQYTHSYQTNTQQIHFNAGSCRFWRGCDSTADNNPLIADIILNYRTAQNVDKLALHRWSMDGWIMQDGYWLLTGLMNDSANAVLGNQTLAQTLADPAQFLNNFSNDVAFRFNQNNIPVEIESIELRGLKATFPANVVSNHILRFN